MFSISIFSIFVLSFRQQLVDMPSLSGRENKMTGLVELPEESIVYYHHSDRSRNGRERRTVILPET